MLSNDRTSGAEFEELVHLGQIGHHLQYAPKQTYLLLLSCGHGLVESCILPDSSCCLPVVATAHGIVGLLGYEAAKALSNEFLLLLVPLLVYRFISVISLIDVSPQHVQVTILVLEVAAINLV